MGHRGCLLRAVIVAVAFAALAGATAHAHLGANFTNAKFTTPPAPLLAGLDGGMPAFMGPYTFAAPGPGGTIDVQWTDGDVDPTGHFYFYYYDHEPTSAESVDQIVASAKPIAGYPSQDGIWASCTCAQDLGVPVTCPDGGTRTMDVANTTDNCANDFQWSTSGLSAGAYWLIAVNNDPPFHVYSVSGGPVLVAAGGQTPPGVIVLRPDGRFAFDQTYHAQWIVSGAPPFSFELSYGISNASNVLLPTAPIVMLAPPVAAADGTYGVDWDVSQLPNADYFFRVEVTDASGLSVFSDSRFPLSVFHPPSSDGGLAAVDLGVPTDLAAPPKKPSGCSTSDGESSPAVTLAPLAVLLALALAVIVVRRLRR